ncbi:hypothetical protein AA103196_2742 [Ameyamaea chiangmaiensis NBRC 103196]|uniref:Uncharacterized protein n=1 Tax=Ameyamaea chiangmaiensis TaxID=442969 RepID=A0A850P9J4_9PROT|nr:hypothetical protein [Ameyamaea chiangmaiensis]MBS4074233.1 hypothetical protein [Ameyamaea chiangmaiensis]NVN41275.1 hypothetical protein [Ameyamaea chiangmaiensis]GBQ71327.1 hypothetical protein AA103196_2742 [Ameyamaea chiangmaiensis NBRC 103196]
MPRHKRTLELAVVFGLALLPATACLRFAHSAPTITVEATTPLNARMIAQRLDSDGAEATARFLDKDAGWLRLRRAVSAGWKNWIALLPALQPYVPEAEVEPLRAAMRHALPTRTRDIVATLDPKNGTVFGGGAVCRRHDLTPAARFRAIRAVESLHDIRDEERAQDCLRALQGR